MRTAGVVAGLALLIAGALLATRFAEAGLHAPQSDIIFPHARHADSSCTDCHLHIERSAAAQDRHFPSMDRCAQCHDIEDSTGCGVCHRHPEAPQPSPHPPRSIVFAHQSHLDRGTDCVACHGTVATSMETAPAHMPTMRQCFTCHDGVKHDDACALCHADHPGLADIHPAEWRHQHGSQAAQDRDWCTQCHREENDCLDCHRGDDLEGRTHDLNYLYTHGTDAKSKRSDCSACHDIRSFCDACHESENRMPLMHSSVAWLANHGTAARRDAEDCAACHDSADPTCGRGGCHNDVDGVRGTNPRLHAAGLARFDTYGPWHGDDDYFCFQCHVNSRGTGGGFCNYCHGQD